MSTSSQTDGLPLCAYSFARISTTSGTSRHRSRKHNASRVRTNGANEHRVRAVNHQARLHHDLILVRRALIAGAAATTSACRHPSLIQGVLHLPHCQEQLRDYFEISGGKVREERKHVKMIRRRPTSSTRPFQKVLGATCSSYRVCFNWKAAIEPVENRRDLKSARAVLLRGNCPG